MATPPPNWVRKRQSGVSQAVNPRETRNPRPAKGEAQTDRAGENLFFPLVSLAEVIITTAGEFVRLGDKDLMILWRPVNHGKLLAESKLHLHLN